MVSQQLAAKHEGLGLQRGSHITELDGNHLHEGLKRQGSGYFVPSVGVWMGDKVVFRSQP
jgi:hypothetical protein